MGIQILIAEDHQLFRDGLISLITRNPEWHIAAEASDGYEALSVLNKQCVDLLLADLSMPQMNGVQLIEQALGICPDLKVLALTAHRNAEYVHAALNAGAHGYVVKDASNDDLSKAITSVMNDQAYIHPAVSKEIILGYLDGKKLGSARDPYERLTQREKEVLQLVVEGFSNKATAEKLYISIKTVEKHKANMMRKLGVSTAAEVCLFVKSKGILP